VSGVRRARCHLHICNKWKFGIEDALVQVFPSLVEQCQILYGGKRRAHGRSENLLIVNMIEGEKGGIELSLVAHKNSSTGIAVFLAINSHLF